jgi:hypothetical protein
MQMEEAVGSVRPHLLKSAMLSDRKIMVYVHLCIATNKTLILYSSMILSPRNSSASTISIIQTMRYLYAPPATEISTT